MKRFINIVKRRSMEKKNDEHVLESKVVHPFKVQNTILVFIVVLLIGNIAAFFSEYGFRVSGNVIGIFTADLALFRFQSMAFIFQWISIISLMAIAAWENRQISTLPESITQKLAGPKISKVEMINLKEFSNSKKSSTDIDVLHAVIQKKGSVKISIIAATFNVSRETALEWSKILESHGLASIHYKVFGDAELTIKDD